MSETSHRLLAVARTPLSYLGGRPQSAVKAVQHVGFTSLDGNPRPVDARISLSGDRRTLVVSIRSGGIDRRALEVWRLVAGDGQRE